MAATLALLQDLAPIAYISSKLPPPSRNDGREYNSTWDARKITRPNGEPARAASNECCICATGNKRNDNNCVLFLTGLTKALGRQDLASDFIFAPAEAKVFCLVTASDLASR